MNFSLRMNIINNKDELCVYIYVKEVLSKKKKYIYICNLCKRRKDLGRIIT